MHKSHIFVHIIDLKKFIEFRFNCVVKNYNTNYMNNLTSKQGKSNSRVFQAIPIVEIKAVTWNKDSHGLFDYENSYYDMKKFIIGENASLARLHNDIVCITEKDETDPVNRDLIEPLLVISKDQRFEDKYCLDIKKFALRRQIPTYLIVRSLKSRDGKTQKGYALSPGDIFKLGRVEYRVSEMQISADPTSLRAMDNSNILPCDLLFDANNQTSQPSDEEQLCKYCLMDKVSDNELENLMLYPCKCSGSSAGVHFGCLRNWVQYKIIAKHSQTVANYHWKKLECEICLEPLPRRIQFGTEIFELINIDKPQTPHIILEKLGEDQKSTSYVLIVPEADQVIKMGRGHQCDFRISDISVSRIHSHLKFEDGKFILYDNDSKFGTLILIDQNFLVREDKAAVQIGRTVFTFVQKKMSIENLQNLNN